MSALRLVPLAFLLPSAAFAGVTVDTEVDPKAHRHSVLTGVSMEASPRLGLGYAFQDTLGTDRPVDFSATVAWHTPMFLIGASDHHGATVGFRANPFQGPWSADVGLEADWQQFDNGVSTGNAITTALSVYPTWRPGRAFVGARVGLRQNLLNHMVFDDNYAADVPTVGDGWYKGTATWLDATLRGGVRVGERVGLEADVGVRKPLGTEILDPFYIPWVAGLRVNVGVGS